MDSLWRLYQAAPHHAAVGAIRVLLADDVDRIRDVLRDLLELDGRFEVVAEAADGIEAVRQAELQQPEAAVLDVSMPLLDGIEALPRIRASSPRTRVVVLSSFDSLEMGGRALAAGASAYVEKGSSVSALIDALLEACRAPGAVASTHVAAGST